MQSVWLLTLSMPYFVHRDLSSVFMEQPDSSYLICSTKLDSKEIKTIWY